MFWIFSLIPTGSPICLKVSLLSSHESRCRLVNRNLSNSREAARPDGKAANAFRHSDFSLFIVISLTWGGCLQAALGVATRLFGVMMRTVSAGQAPPQQWPPSLPSRFPGKVIVCDRPFRGDRLLTPSSSDD